MRGYFEIGIFNPKKDCNYGTLMRSAYQLGAAGVFVIGARFKRQVSDTCNASEHIPAREFADFDSFFKQKPLGANLVAIESPEYGGRQLNGFYHPKQAIYLLGAEDSGLPIEIVKKCDFIVSIESIRQPSYNVAMAGTIVMYDRMIKNLK